MRNERLPLPLKLLVGFFAFGTAMALLTSFLLAFSGTVLDSLWHFNPEAHEGFQHIGKIAFVLMLIVASACASAAFGLAHRAEWGRIVAIIILGVNLLGDSINALVRHDYRPLIGLPIGAGLVWYLSSRRVRRLF